jgi:UTP--glucose-1-phosphate uridylyltransferase
MLEREEYLLNLPLIRNKKSIDPRNPESTPVFQLETAMGSAISVFDQAAAVRVPRTRFSPVKNCVDLLAVRSDLTVLTSGYHLSPHPSRTIGPFEGDLDSRYYGRISDFESRFPGTPPSLLNCRSLRIEGDFIFGSHIKLEGDVEMINLSERVHLIPDGACIEGLWKV